VASLDMHVHVYPYFRMRTTIELRDDQRARLLEIAAQEGRKGFSHLIEEAVDRFLDEEADRREEVAQALALVGSFGSEEAEALRTRTRELRARWR
jgi:predicted transcriptional regulator